MREGALPLTHHLASSSAQSTEPLADGSVLFFASYTLSLTFFFFACTRCILLCYALCAPSVRSSAASNGSRTLLLANDNMKSSTFKAFTRVVLCLTTIGAVLLFVHYQNLGDQYGVVDYFTFSVLRVTPNRPYEPKLVGSIAGDKIIVMAKMEEEDTSWVAEELTECVQLVSIHTDQH